MNRMKLFVIASCLGLLAVAFLPSSKADESNKRTIITINEPLAIPGKVLQPGKYVLRLLDSPSDRHIVQIFNGDETQIQSTILAIPNYKLEPADKTEFSFWEMPAGQPRALKAWFYPGDNFGQEFAYPKDLATMIAKTNSENVPTVSEDNQISQTTPSGEAQQMAENNASAGSSSTTAAAEPSPSANSSASTDAQNQPPASSAAGETAQSNADMNHQTPAQPDNSQNMAGAQANTGTTTTARNQLPRTASPFPLAGLAGLLSLGGAVAARVLRRAA